MLGAHRGRFNFPQEWRNVEDLRESVMIKLGLEIGIDASWTEKER